MTIIALEGIKIALIAGSPELLHLHILYYVSIYKLPDSVSSLLSFPPPSTYICSPSLLHLAPPINYQSLSHHTLSLLCTSYFPLNILGPDQHLDLEHSPGFASTGAI